MSCFSCFSSRRKDVQNYDDDNGIRSADSAGFLFNFFMCFTLLCPLLLLYLVQCALTLMVYVYLWSSRLRKGEI